MSNQKKYDTLRKTYPTFVYDSYKYNVQPDGLHIMFSFRMGDHIFQPTSLFPARTFLHFDQPREVMDSLVFNIGLVELVSYWKCACPPRVEVRCGTLDEDQIAFWKKLYWHGLGEFFYVNGIDATQDDFLSIVVDKNENAQRSTLNAQRSTLNYLVPIGGGKDSVVTLELLMNAGMGKVIPLIMNPRGATIGCIEAAEYTMDDVLVIRRTIDPHLLELNAAGFLNGHTPFSAMLAFYTLLAAQLCGIPNIALSNENSANESTVVGTSVNHQYSKSLEFENDFRNYVQTLSTLNSQLSTLNYFSFLRPLSEPQIAMLFSRFEKYHPVFRSCNVGSKQDIWCGHCAKCLFAYIILSPFLSPEQLTAIFGRNLLDDTSLRLEFDQLRGVAATKPFECVGTVDEVNAALAMALQRWYTNTPKPALLADWQPATTLNRRSATASGANSQLSTLNSNHNLSPKELEILKTYVQRASV